MIYQIDGLTLEESVMLSEMLNEYREKKRVIENSAKAKAEGRKLTLEEMKEGYRIVGIGFLMMHGRGVMLPGIWSEDGGYTDEIK